MRIFNTLYILLFFLPQLIIGQEQSNVFSSLSLGFSYNINSSENEFNRYWDVNKSGSFSIETPFYFGIIKAGVSFTSLNARSSMQPDFESINYYLLWGERIDVAPWLSLRIAGGPGLYEMEFEENDTLIDENLLTERELAFKIEAGIVINFNKTIGIEGSYTYNKIMTNKPITLNFLNVGLIITLMSPEWLIDILK